MRIFALSLGLDETYFDAFVTSPGCMSRILHYPPQPVPGEERIGIEAHTVRTSLVPDPSNVHADSGGKDYECFTILSQDEVPALQVLNAHNQWVTAPPLPDTLVVNIGDFFAFWYVCTVSAHTMISLTAQDGGHFPIHRASSDQPYGT